MELIWNETDALRLILHRREQVEIEGSLPLPAGRIPADILDYSPDVSVNACRTEDGKMSINGSISAAVTAVDAGGEVFAFISESPFSHILDDGVIESGMLSEALPSVTMLTVRLTPDGRIMLAATVDLECFVTSAKSLRLLGGVSGVPDMEIKTQTLSYRARTELGNAVIHLSDEIASGGADSVLTSAVKLAVRDTVFENGGVTVSGMASCSILCRSAGGELMQLERSIPFRESVLTDGTADEVYACAVLRSGSARALGTEFSLIAFEADVELRVFGIKRNSLVLPLDAFSPSISFNCIRQETKLLSVLGGANTAHVLRENVTVPEGMADIFTAVSSSARPVITETRFSDGEMQLEGLLATRLVYRSSGGTLHSFSEDVPFTLVISSPAGADTAKLHVNCTCSVTGGSGRAAQITYNIEAGAEYLQVDTLMLAVGLAEQNPQPRPEASAFPCDGFSGMIIHSADENETVFDIAKRYSIPSSRVRELNPDCGDVFSDGEKVLLIV